MARSKAQRGPGAAKLATVMAKPLTIRVSAKASSCLLGLINQEIAGVIRMKAASANDAARQDWEAYLQLLQECSVAVIAAHMTFVQQKHR